MYSCFSDTYLKSKIMFNDQNNLSDSNYKYLYNYYNDINYVSHKIFTIKIDESVDDITHNFNEVYQYYFKFIKDNIEVVKESDLPKTNACNLVSKKFVNSKILPDDCLNLIYLYS